MEMLVVVVIMAVLATLALNNYGPFKETTLTKEAVTSLKLIKAAERIYRMEYGKYFPCTGGGPCPGTAGLVDINQKLKLLLPQATNWDYKVVSSDANANFTAKARRQSTGTVWCIDQRGTVEEPYQSGCSW